MKETPVVRSQQATSDVEAAAEHYWSAVSATQTQRFLNALEETYQHISRFPGSGSPRYAPIVDVPDLRSWPVKGFPYLVLYAEQASSIDIYRLLHTACDIPESLSEDMED